MAVMSQDRQAAAMERIADALEKILEKLSPSPIIEPPMPLEPLPGAKPKLK